MIKNRLRACGNSAIIVSRDIPTILTPCWSQGVRDHKEVLKHMNNYELAVILSSKLEDEQRAAALEQIKELVKRFGGQIKDIDEWGKKKLAYEIQKEKEGFYYFIHFDAEPTAPAEIESRIRIMEPVLRYLCMRPEA